MQFVFANHGKIYNIAASIYSSNKKAPAIYLTGTEKLLEPAIFSE